MEKKKVVYQITRKKYRLVEVDTEEQETLVKELNRDFEREYKREKVSCVRCVSLDELSENGEFVAAGNSPTPEETVIAKDQDERMKNLLHKAFVFLTERQKEVLKKCFGRTKQLERSARNWVYILPRFRKYIMPL